jgi:hypothetical protein
MHDSRNKQKNNVTTENQYNDLELARKTKFMKKKLFVITLVALGFCDGVKACAICGCGAGNYYLGVMPQFSKNFIGLRYRSYSFTSHVGQGYNPYEATNETFQSAELWTRFYVTNRIQLISFVNFNFNRQLDGGVTKEIQGIGDIPLLVNYNLINTSNEPLSEKRILNHSLFLGGGIKLPVGKYRYSEDPKAVANANFQLGTGSIDFIITSLYTLRYRRFGLSLDANYKINTANSNQYRFGNRLSGTSSLFYVQQIKNVGVMPNAGFYFEDSALNKQYGLNIENTGGSALFASVGLESYYKKISIGFNFQKPIEQQLADNHSIAHNRATIHMSFLF